MGRNYVPMDVVERDLIVGPLGKRQLDVTGHRYGRFTVLRYVGKDRSCKSYWLVRCDCGVERVLFVGALRFGRYQSCGCLRSDVTTGRNTIHDHAHRKEFSGEYNSWRGMLERCYNEKSIGYLYYGGRGITVCERWRTSAAAFLEDMGPKPTSQHSIDRRRNDLGYTPENCFWATKTEQAKNRRVVERGPEVTQFTVYARKRKARQLAEQPVASLRINLLEPRVLVVDRPGDEEYAYFSDDGC